MEISKDGVMKVYTRSLFLEAARKLLAISQNKELEMFSLPSDALVLEAYLSEYCKSNNIDLLLHCVEKDSKTYESAKQKISNNLLLDPNTILTKTSDHSFYRKLDRKHSDQQFDLAWHDWCGPIDETKIDTFTMSCLRLKKSNVIGITLMEDMRNAKTGKTLINKFGRWFKSSQKELIIPMLLNFRVKQYDLSLVPQQALKYRTCFPNRMPSTWMLFYLFSVQSKFEKIPHRQQIKPWMYKNFQTIESDAGVLRPLRSGLKKEIYAQEI